MYCAKCGAEIPEDSAFCQACGAPASSEAGKQGERWQASRWLDRSSEWAQANPAGSLIIFGALLAILGAFLPWVSRGGALGVGMPEGAVVCALGVLSLSALLLARTGAAGAWNTVMLLLSALTLALVFQSLYHIKHWHVPAGAGLWIALVGAIVLAAGAVLQQWDIIKK